jgi:hypothetical protein
VTNRPIKRPAAGLILAIAIVAPLSVFAETVKITIPAAVTFAVTNVSNSTIGTPNPTTVSFSSLSVTAGHTLRISVKADADFTPPSGTAIPASMISWVTSSPTNGTGTNGTLSKTVYGQVFQSTLTKSAGSVSVRWTLAAPGGGIRSGAHTLVLRWKLESI